MLSLQFHIPVYQLRLDAVRVVEVGGKETRTLMQRRLIAGLDTEGHAIPPAKRGITPPMMRTGQLFKSMKLRLRGEGFKARARVVFSGARSRKILRAQWVRRKVRIQGMIKPEWARVRERMRVELVRQQQSGEFGV